MQATLDNAPDPRDLLDLKMGLLILTVIFGVVLIDFLLIGIIPPLLGIWPRISELGKNKRIMESSLLGASTNLKGKHIESQVNKRRGFSAAVLTYKHFFLRVNRLNYLLKIDVSAIDRIEIGKSIIGKNLTIIFSINSERYFFELRSTKMESWIQGFETIGVPVFRKEI
jgi:hypothetical protein